MDLTKKNMSSSYFSWVILVNSYFSWVMLVNSYFSWVMLVNSECWHSAERQREGRGVPLGAHTWGKAADDDTISHNKSNNSLQDLLDRWKGKRREEKNEESREREREGGRARGRERERWGGWGPRQSTERMDFTLANSAQQKSLTLSSKLVFSILFSFFPLLLHHTSLVTNSRGKWAAVTSQCLCFVIYLFITCCGAIETWKTPSSGRLAALLSEAR